ncbi:MAG: tRNA uridine(34) 5-carboxymethylaminomethyl modification radical SAM/GNAT enzyme Elp3 [Candidatus Latescibacteria bacterium]|nr:tRNA uridine(34) 5-carboxymethylaminomethyl modification radical SAM/GNAT enzyme Elp3 [Candidatus Latescibacterota bacterium]
MTNEKIGWQKSQLPSRDQLVTARQILHEVQEGESVFKSIRRHPLPDGGYVAKHILVRVYYLLVKNGELESDAHLLREIRMKPMRTLSGVTTITVLTKPFPCPGNCIFCPDDELLPKSYIRKEPGAARAFQNNFDPFLQVVSRLESYQAIGHPTNKIELLILGGCWTAYPQDYQEWFIQRCFDALNGTEFGSLAEAQKFNQTTDHRNVGLVIETRPDEIKPEVLVHLRRLGVTKVQMGAQSFDDHILALNRRGHTAHATLKATALLRAAGFKIVLHWMPNLLGATLESDQIDFNRMWNEGFCPDEIKIYPTQLVESADLYQVWKEGKYHPYSTEQLVQLIADIKPSIPPYCRVNRVIRDIPADYIVAGSKRSSLRQDALKELTRRGQQCQCIRCREIRGQVVDQGQLEYQDITYLATGSNEHFLSFVTPDNHLVAYLRLSIAAKINENEFEDTRRNLYQLIPELQGAAIIREVHVYGQSLEVGSEQAGAAQHIGLGTTLLKKAEEITRQVGLKRLVVISAVGTREYYRSRGFAQGDLYMTKILE